MKQLIKNTLAWVFRKTGIAPVYVPVKMYNNESVYTVISGRLLEGKTAVVTGASGSLGRAITARLISEGAHVYAAGRNEARLAPVVTEMNRLAPGQCTALPLQMDDERAVESAVKAALGGRPLDIWINCAGGSARDKAAPMHQQSMEVVDDVLRSNLRLCITGSKIAAACMVTQGSGRIINISSTIAERGKIAFSDYAAAKAGIIGFTRSLALEVGPHGITANCVSPGFIQRGEYSEHQREYLLRSNCMHAIGKPEDIAHAVTFLASPQAGFITGQNLQVDGGRSLGLMGDS
ncbi:MAG: SDR family oxidoreductase [Akkermansiaceae bacterium]|nr:SDR family oxidoreductase [Akkermansiaceae bacterium]